MARQPMGVDISVLGNKQLQKQLKLLAGNMQKKIVRQALRAAAKPVLAAAKAKCPVKSGRLEKSLKLRAMKRKRGQFGVRIKTGTKAELGIPADDKFYYPAHVELGHGSVPAVPYMRSALEENRSSSLRIVALMVKAGIDKVTVTQRGRVDVG